MLILYDGNCPICCAKKEFLHRRDHKDKLAFSNIRSPDFQSLEIPVPVEQLEKEIHSIMPDKTILRGMDVIRAAYKETGIGWLAAPTGWPVFRPLFDRIYIFVAANRALISQFPKFGKR